MTIQGSQLTGMGSVLTAAGAQVGVPGGATLVHGQVPGIAVDNTDPLNPIVSNTGVLSVNGATGAVFVNGVTTADSVNTTGVKLSAVASASFTAGAWAYVSTVGDFFVLRQSALAVDNITVVNAAGKAGFQWVRLGLPNKLNATVAFWSVDPVNGADENVGGASTAAAADLVALKTIGEVSRRLRGITLAQNTSIRLLGSLGSTDVNDWSTTTVPASFRLTVLGVNGPATGPGGAVDNTLYTGSVTAFIDAGMAPAATDTELTDTAIPVSFTASGLLAAEIIFQRTNSTLLSWYAAADLGGKTIQINAPCNNTGSAARLVLTVGDTYKAYQMPKLYGQEWGASAGQVTYDSVADNQAGFQVSEGQSVLRRRVWLSTARTLVLTQLHLNCCFGYGGGTIVGTSLGAFPQILGGLFRGAGADAYNYLGGKVATLYWPCLRGCTLRMEGTGGYLGIEQGIEVQSVTGVAITAALGAVVCFCGTVASGLIGKGNTSTLLAATGGSLATWTGNAVTPPVVAGSSSSGTPLQIGTAAAQAVGALPIYPFDKAGVAPLAVGNGMYQT